MINQWAKVKTVLLVFMNKVVLHVVLLLILINALESESFACASFVSVSLVVDVDNTYWSSLNVSSDGE